MYVARSRAGHGWLSSARGGGSACRHERLPIGGVALQSYPPANSYPYKQQAQGQPTTGVLQPVPGLSNE